MLAELDEMRRRAEATRAEAVHEESRAENDKDTRGLEASYLARGQAERVAELTAGVQLLRHMDLPDFTDESPIAIGALVDVESELGVHHYLVAPAGGGTRVKAEEREIQLLTPTAPLGRALIGTRTGDTVELRLRGALRELEVISVR